MDFRLLIVVVLACCLIVALVSVAANAQEKAPTYVMPKVAAKNSTVHMVSTDGPIKPYRTKGYIEFYFYPKGKSPAVIRRAYRVPGTFFGAGYATAWSCDAALTCATAICLIPANSFVDLAGNANVKSVSAYLELDLEPPTAKIIAVPKEWKEPEK